MYKKSRKLAIILVFSLVISLASVINASASSNGYNSTIQISGQAETPQLDLNTMQDGYVKIAYNNESQSKMRVLVEKNDTKYYYDFYGKGNYENYSLNMGDGVYKLYLLENTEGKNYMIIGEWDIDAKIQNENECYTISNKIVNYENSKSVIEKANKLTVNLKTDEAKAMAIYNYIVTNVKYDSKKQSTLAAGYVPVIDEIVQSKSGICYDFSAVYAGMLRSIGIPTKLIMGTSKNVKGYHAWNEVFLNGKWLIIDTSYDSQLNEKAKVAIFKSSEDYNNSKQY